MIVGPRTLLSSGTPTTTLENSPREPGHSFSDSSPLDLEGRERPPHGSNDFSPPLQKKKRGRWQTRKGSWRVTALDFPWVHHSHRPFTSTSEDVVYNVPESYITQNSSLFLCLLLFSDKIRGSEKTILRNYTSALPRCYSGLFVNCRLGSSSRSWTLGLPSPTLSMFDVRTCTTYISCRCDSKLRRPPLCLIGKLTFSDLSVSLSLW